MAFLSQALRCAALLVAAALCADAAAAAAGTAPFDPDAAWAAFRQRYGRTYADAAEAARRRGVFLARHHPHSTAPAAARLRQLQADNPVATFGVTKFSDRTDEELAKMACRGGVQAKLAARPRTQVELPPLPVGAQAAAEGQRVNWTAHGAVTDVKNQGNCGGCWAFATAANIEGQWALKGHPLVSLSAQQLVSCDTKDSGCEGSYAYKDTEEWIVGHNNGTLATWASYPYTSADGVTGKCDPHRGRVGAWGIDSGHAPAAGLEAVASYCFQHGPVQISVVSRHLPHYYGGIITHGNCQPDAVDHEVLLAGFDRAHAPPYWIVKNSWGTDWGEYGYYRVAMTSHDIDCIAEYPYNYLFKAINATAAASPAATAADATRSAILAARDKWNRAE